MCGYGSDARAVPHIFPASVPTACRSASEAPRAAADCPRPLFSTRWSCVCLLLS